MSSYAHSLMMMTNLEVCFLDDVHCDVGLVSGTLGNVLDEVIGRTHLMSGAVARLFTNCAQVDESPARRNDSEEHQCQLQQLMMRHLRHFRNGLASFFSSLSTQTNN